MIAAIGAVAAVVLGTATPAAADNCSVFTDCFGQSQAASEAALGLTALAAFSLIADFIAGRGVLGWGDGPLDGSGWAWALGLLGSSPGSGPAGDTLPPLESSAVDGWFDGVWGDVLGSMPAVNPWGFLAQTDDVWRDVTGRPGAGSTVAGAVNHFFGTDVFDGDRWSGFFGDLYDGGQEISSLLPGSLENMRMMYSNPGELLDRYGSFGLGLWDFTRNTAVFVHDASSVLPATPAWFIEMNRWRETGEHRGYQMVGQLGEVASGLSSLNPMHPTYYTELYEVARTASIADHEGYQTAGSLIVGIVDWETFKADPSRWFGRMSGEILTEVATAGAASGIGLGDNALRAVDDVVDAVPPRSTGAFDDVLSAASPRSTGAFDDAPGPPRPVASGADDLPTGSGSGSGSGPGSGSPPPPSRPASPESPLPPLRQTTEGSTRSSSSVPPTTSSSRSGPGDESASASSTGRKSEGGSPGEDPTGPDQREGGTASDGGEPYTSTEIDELTAHGRSLGMSDSDIEGLIEQMGLDRAKRGPATPEQIRESMSVWTDEVRPRGYPNLFTTIEQFGEFSEGLRQLLNDYGISTEKVYVQGSSLSSTVPGDVDIAVVVSDQAFDSYVETAIDGIAARANPRAAERIIADLEAYAEKGLVPEFYFERLADGPSTSFAAHLRSSDFVPADIKLDVSIMRRSSSRLHPPILELP